MAGKWRDTTLGEFLRLQRGHDLTEADRRPGLVPIMGSAGHNGFHDTAKATGPGVVIGRSGVGSMGVVSYCATDYWPHNTVLYVTDFLGNDERFAYYFLHHLNLRRFDSGSAQASLNRNYIYPIRIRVPHPVEQRAIAHILGTLDDKIELNRQMNETLEAMARALFKSWFVDFEPVRAKAEGRDPRLPKPLADLFPDSFADSEVGQIPKSWGLRQLGDLLELAYGKALKAEDRHGGDVPVYGSNGRVGWHDERLAAGPGIVVGRKGNPGVATWAPTDFFVIDTAFYVVAKPVCGSAHFLFHVLQTHDLASLGADSAVPGLNRNLAYMSSQVLPPQRLLDKFDSYTSSLAARVQDCSEESRTLAALRDALLPKLVSGELRVKDPERFMRRVTP
ncbi:MAG: restriction endonuclease subunit S [Deltaproteobacteria bacterium]|nr:restriction endonuclease subunit S [Deltaproteobacteria bacterium]